MNTMYSITSKNQVTLPKEVRKILKIGSSHRIQYKQAGGKVYIERAVSVSSAQDINKKILAKKGKKPASEQEISSARSKFYADNQSW